MEISQVYLKMSLQEGQIMINSLSHYLTCDRCLESYSSALELLKNEAQSASVLSYMCTTFDKTQVYNEFLQEITEHYARS